MVVNSTRIEADFDPRKHAAENKLQVVLVDPLGGRSEAKPLPACRVEQSRRFCSIIGVSAETPAKFLTNAAVSPFTVLLCLAPPGHPLPLRQSISTGISDPSCRTTAFSVMARTKSTGWRVCGWIPRKAPLRRPKMAS